MVEAFDETRPTRRRARCGRWRWRWSAWPARAAARGRTAARRSAGRRAGERRRVTRRELAGEGRRSSAGSPTSSTPPGRAPAGAPSSCPSASRTRATRRTRSPRPRSGRAATSRSSGRRRRRCGPACSSTTRTSTSSRRTTPSIVRTPLVLAMWEPMARALGWPRQADRVRRRAPPRAGPARLGRPRAPRVRGVQVRPHEPAASTSGWAPSPPRTSPRPARRRGSRVADVDRPEVARQIARIEQSIVHYGDATPFIEDQLRKNGPTYASAVAMEETTLRRVQQRPGGQPKLVGIYPRRGRSTRTARSSSSRRPGSMTPSVPARRLPALRRRARHAGGGRASTASGRPTRRRSVAAGRRRARRRPEAARPARCHAPAGRARAHPARLVRQPQGGEHRAGVDTSASMSQEMKLAHAKVGCTGSSRELSPRDRVGLIAFSDDVRRARPGAAVLAEHGELTASVRDLIGRRADRALRRHRAGVDDVAALHDTDRINAVVVLSDGMDNGQRDDRWTSSSRGSRRTPGRRPSHPRLHDRLWQGRDRPHPRAHRRVVGRHSPSRATPRTSSPSTAGSRASSEWAAPRPNGDS